MGAEGIEAMGEAVTGGLAARALEPGAGEAGAEGGGACLNCGTALVGPHCHRCGQAARVHRTVSAWWHDLAHGVMHLDGKAWRTLPMLAWRPGELTRRYVEGQRARFVSPLALFLFSVFLMFALFSMLGITSLGIGNSEAARAEAAAELSEADGKVARLEAERRRLVAQGASTAMIDEQLAETRAERRMLRMARGGAGAGGPLFESRVNTGWPRVDEGIRKANENPQLLFYKLQTNAYKFSWALIPISVPFLWLLFLHRRRYRREYKAYDHLVFVTYSIAFMSLMLIAFVLLRAVGLGGGLLNLALILVPPLHIYRQLRGAYALSRASALWRTFALLFFSGVALTLFLALLLAMGVLA
jgi:Protein of unknown function (DUF3667)